MIGAAARRVLPRTSALLHSCLRMALCGLDEKRPVGRNPDMGHFMDVAVTQLQQWPRRQLSHCQRKQLEERRPVCQGHERDRSSLPGRQPLLGWTIFRFVRGNDVVDDTFARLSSLHEFGQHWVMYFQSVSNQTS